MESVWFWFICLWLIHILRLTCNLYTLLRFAMTCSALKMKCAAFIVHLQKRSKVLYYIMGKNILYILIVCFNQCILIFCTVLKIMKFTGIIEIHLKMVTIENVCSTYCVQRNSKVFHNISLWRNHSLWHILVMLLCNKYNEIDMNLH